MTCLRLTAANSVYPQVFRDTKDKNIVIPFVTVQFGSVASSVSVS
jgi:hypothetical protein